MMLYPVDRSPPEGVGALQRRLLLLLLDAPTLEATQTMATEISVPRIGRGTRRTPAAAQAHLHVQVFPFFRGT